MTETIGLSRDEMTSKVTKRLNEAQSTLEGAFNDEQVRALTEWLATVLDGLYDVMEDNNADIDEAIAAMIASGPAKDQP